MIQFLFSSALLSILIFSSGGLLAEDKIMSVKVVGTEKGSDYGTNAEAKYDQPSSKYVVTLPSGKALQVTVSDEHSQKKNHNWEGEDTDCNKASIGFVACKNLKAQESIKVSTEDIKDWTRGAAWAAWFATIAGAISIGVLIFTYRQANSTNEISQKTGRLQLQPWLTVNEPTVRFVQKDTMPHPHPTEPGKLVQSSNCLFNISIPVMNEGKTPVTSAEFHATKIVVTYSFGDKVVFEAYQDYETTISTPINPGKVWNSDFPAMLSLISGNMDSIAEGDCSFHIEFELAFKDSFSEKETHRFMSATITSDGMSNTAKIVVAPEVARKDEEGGFYLKETH